MYSIFRQGERAPSQELETDAKVLRQKENSQIVYYLSYTVGEQQRAPCPAGSRIETNARCIL